MTDFRHPIYLYATKAEHDEYFFLFVKNLHACCCMGRTTSNSGLQWTDDEDDDYTALTMKILCVHGHSLFPC